MDRHILIRAAIAWLPIVFGPSLPAQTPPINGMRPADLRAHAIIDATIVVSPGQKIEHASIIIRKGVIEAVGTELAVPHDATIWPGQGMMVYPGLIDAALLVKPEDAPRSGAAHWNSRVHPELTMADQPRPDKALCKELRSMGFTAAAVYPSTGAWRGRGAVLALADETEHVLAYGGRPAMAAAFDYGGGGPGRGREATPAVYPGSLMGAIALLRQTLYDAQWHSACRNVWQTHPEGNEPPARNDSMMALAEVIERRQPVLFEVNDEQNLLRAARLSREFNLDLQILGSGYEFRRLNEVIAVKTPLIVPLDFPKRPDVSTLATADSVSLRDLMTWEQAPTNARRLIAAAEPATVALTTHKLKSRGDFHANLRSAIKHGLSEDDALTALTTTPAKILGLENILGTIEPGKAANLVVVKGSLFDKESKIHDTWINGRRYEIHKEPDVQLKGKGRLRLNTQPDFDLAIELDSMKSTLTITLPDDKKISAKKLIVQQDQLSFVVDGRPFDAEGYVRLSGVIEKDTVSGVGELPDGSTFRFIITIEPQTAGPETQPTQTKPDQPERADAPESDEDKPGDVSGVWNLRLAEGPQDMAITLNLTSVEANAVKGTINVMGQMVDISAGTFDPATGKLSFTFVSPQGGQASVEADVSGNTMTGRVSSTSFTGDFAGDREGGPETGGRGRKGAKGEADPPFMPPPEELIYPLGEYGLAEPHRPQNVLITNATIWTCGPQGIIENGSMLILNGKIRAIGEGTSAGNVPDALAFPTIDLKGKHITPGLVDCHSHTGISGGVNEWAQANTAEVRIGDCIDPDDINWYRELAGGLTACNQLHGSANPIGGQNSVVKLKWGGGADDFRIEDAIAGIKFALGENVKRSAGRYPNTRMGVETFIRDAFTAAREYTAARDRYEALPQNETARTMPPRRDLELEALAEILDEKRLVHCHSYRQDEILMLIRVADAFGFTIGTFQHVLEGYKVAEAIAAHGAGGSSFSDWWAYKVEVMDAIPYNGTMMHNAGVLVSFNSDSDELARRMNTEAAKAVRYGGLSPEEALKFVTINPARQLRIDHRTGSLEEGKDADFVIWSGDPLSVYTRCEQTWIEGTRCFDLETDQQLRDAIHGERQRIIQKILIQTHGELPKPGAETQPSTAPAETQPESVPQTKPEHSLVNLSPQHQAWMEEQARLGRDPHEIRPGDCGCNDHWAHSHE